MTAPERYFELWTFLHAAPFPTFGAGLQVLAQASMMQKHGKMLSALARLAPSYLRGFWGLLFGHTFLSQKHKMLKAMQKLFQQAFPASFFIKGPQLLPAAKAHPTLASVSPAPLSFDAPCILQLLQTW